MKKDWFFRAILWIICLYHVTAGLLAIVSDRCTEFAAKALVGATFTEGAQFHYLIKPFGLYVLCFGLFMGAAAWNPVKNRTALTIGAILFIIRALQRIAFASEFEQAFQVPPGRNWMTIIVVATFAVILIVYRVKLYREVCCKGQECHPQCSVGKTDET